MQFAGIFIAVCLMATVYGEQCTVNSDCVSTTCGSGTSVVCQHPDGAGIVSNGGLCTCEDSTSGECTSRDECYGNNSNLQCPDSMRHCYDNKCICDRFPTECVMAVDCYGTSSGLQCADSMRHCYDGKCICDRFPGGK